MEGGRYFFLAFLTTFFLAGFLAAAFFTGAFFAGAFFLAGFLTGIQIPPFLTAGAENVKTL